MVGPSRYYVWCSLAHGLLPRKVDGVDKAQVALVAVQIDLQGKGVLVLQRDSVAGAVLPGKGSVPLLIGLEGHLRGALLIEQVGFLHVQLRIGGDVAGGEGQLVTYLMCIFASVLGNLINESFKNIRE